MPIETAHEDIIVRASQSPVSVIRGNHRSATHQSSFHASPLNLPMSEILAAMGANGTYTMMIDYVGRTDPTQSAQTRYSYSSHPGEAASF